MADVKKINGYDIKDASARDDISSLDTRVGNLESTIDTPSTGLSARVSDLESSVGSLNENAIVNGDFAVLESEEGTLVLTSYENGYPYPTTIFLLDLPDGFTANNTYILGGDYTVYYTEGDETTIEGNRPLGESFYGNTKDSTVLKNTYGFQSSLNGDKVYVDFENYVSHWVGYKIKAKVLVMKRDNPVSEDVPE